MRNAVAELQRQLQATLAPTDDKTVDGTGDQVLGLLRESALSLGHPQSPGLLASGDFQGLQFDRRVVRVGERVALLRDVRDVVGRVEEHVVGGGYVNDVRKDFPVQRMHHHRFHGFAGRFQLPPLPGTWVGRSEDAGERETFKAGGSSGAFNLDTSPEGIVSRQAGIDGVADTDFCNRLRHVQLMGRSAGNVGIESQCQVVEQFHVILGRYVK